MTSRNSVKYGIVLVGALTLIVLGLAFSNSIQSSQENSKPSNNINEPLSSSMSFLLEEYTHEDLSKNSDVIVMGTVKEILPSRWNSVDGKRPDKVVEFGPYDLIYTDIVISVDKYVKNPLSSEDVIVRVGGTVGNDSMAVEDEPSFKTGEKVLLYLTKDTSPGTKDIGPEHFKVTGYIQGKFALTDDGRAIGWNNESVSQEELLRTIKE